MKLKFSSLLFLMAFSVFSQNYHRYVNPMIGTGGHGHTYPGATVPYGMVQLSPDTRVDGSWDGCSGYHYDDKIIYGFSHTHLNGTGCSDFGDIMLMPTMGKSSLNPKEYSSTFSHSNEKASAGFYKVKLDKHNIDVKLTASTRVGFHEYTFNKAGQANIVLDLNHRDKLLEGEIHIINPKTIEVKRVSEAWAKNQYVYARIEFSAPVKLTKIRSNGDYMHSISDEYSGGTESAVCLSKQVKKGEKIMVKVSLSPTSYEGAKVNISEIKDWNFERVKKEAEQLWEQQLSKIENTETNRDKLAVFYTALYHTMVQPNIAQDIGGKYRGRDNQIHQAVGFDYYSVFSLWDTFRAAHPLYTLIEKKRTSDFINTFLKQYEQGGRLPVWELASNETDCMIGYHSVSVIADAMAKGITGFDYEKAFEAAKHSAMLDHLGLEAYKKQGFISMDDEHESVSKTLEYAYDDWCIAQMAQILKKNEDYEYFMKRSQSWKNVFDWNTGFMRPKKNGGWDKPFDPKEINNNFTEGNSWQYSFFVPQDIPGMIQAYGGAAKFEAKLDEMFNSESKTTGREQVDVTGLIGQYAHGNEPSHHMAYLYNFIGKPEKTNEKVHYILNNFYKNAPDGLIGNEDCGQMSAWYVMSSMGIYAVTPGKSQWSVTQPNFEKIKVSFEDKTAKSISKKMLVDDLKYFGIKNNDLLTADGFSFDKIIPVPVIQSESKAFKNKTTIEIFSQNPNDIIYFMISDKNDYLAKKMFVPYSKPFEIQETSTVLAYIKNNDGQSNTVSATYFKKPNNYNINIKSTYNPQYHAGGPEGLLDGIHGTENWRKGDWQGYQGQDFEAIIDLQKETTIHSIGATFLQDSRSWILLPTKVEYFVSHDNVNFTLVGSIDHTISPKYEVNIIKDFTYSSETDIKTKYIKVKAYNFGKLPEWHQGFGGDSFIFIDEIYFSHIKEDICYFPILMRVFFSKNKSMIDNSEKLNLENYLKHIKNTPSLKFTIEGNCDATEKNRKALSLKRAREVKKFFVSNGISKSRIKTQGFSDFKLINECDGSVNCSDEKNRQNRRCDFIITGLEP